MSVLVDSGVFYAHADSDAGRHSKAVRAFDALIDGIVERIEPGDLNG
jgi:predicted nucleic acid-binding protein